VGLPVCIVALLADGHAFRSDKRVYENKTLGIGVPYLIYVPHIGLCHIVGLLGLLHRRSRVMHSLGSRGHDVSRSRLLHHTGQTNAVDEWARAKLIVSGVSHGLNGEKAEAFGMPLTILGVGSEWPLQLPLWYK
jgi:hypothetical protein